MGARRLEEQDEVAQNDEAWDQLDVPAAVVCAHCGDPGCSGCMAPPSSTRSGIVAIVPWERPGTAVLVRLWNTARATTKNPESFFGTLPDGPVATAFAFALLAELVASTSWGVAAGALLWAVFPRWSWHIVVDPHARGVALSIVACVLPLFSLMLVSAHAVHGLSLDRGARKAGASSSRRRALRFGLYAAGWDLVIGPIGACVLAYKEGLMAASEVTQLGRGLPTRSATGFLRGVYGLDLLQTKAALRTSYVVAVVATLAAAFVVVGLLVVGVLLFPPHLLSY